jgi:hypothetical protein
VPVLCALPFSCPSWTVRPLAHLRPAARGRVESSRVACLPSRRKENPEIPELTAPRPCAMDRSSSVCAATEPGVASSLGGNAPQVIDDSTLPASFSGMAPGAGSATVSSALATELGPAEGTTSTEAATEDGGQDEPMTCLPPSTIPTKELIALVQRAMTERNVTQNRLCGKLCLSPVYFSMWLREKQVRAAAPGMRLTATRATFRLAPTHTPRPLTPASTPLRALGQSGAATAPCLQLNSQPARRA